MPAAKRKRIGRTARRELGLRVITCRRDSIFCGTYHSDPSDINVKFLRDSAALGATTEQGTNCTDWTKMYFHMATARTHVVLSLAILLECCACAFALDPSLDISQYAHTAWTGRNGFLNG